MNEGKPKVAFVCMHNSCRSQIAEALGKKLASDVFESYSAGTELKDRINPDAVRLMKKLYGIDMEQTQYNKLITDIPNPDVVIFMGCNVSCPNVPGKYAENWGLEDPSGQSDEVFEETIRKIEENIKQLRQKLSNKESVCTKSRFLADFTERDQFLGLQISDLLLHPEDPAPFSQLKACVVKVTDFFKAE